VSGSKRLGMNSLVRPVTVSFDNDRMNIELSDGRKLGVPLAWFPRLLRAPREQLEDYELSPCGIHWETLDEDISIAGLLAGHSDQTRESKAKRQAEAQDAETSARYCCADAVQLKSRVMPRRISRRHAARSP
jgi:hypothetical protein